MSGLYSRKNIALCTLFLFVLGQIVPHPLGIPLSLVVLTLISFLIGSALLPARQWYLQIVIGLLMVCSIVSVVGTLAFYLAPSLPNTFWRILTLICIALGAFGPPISSSFLAIRTHVMPRVWLITSLYVIAILTVFVHLITRIVPTTIVSPWQVVSPLFVLALAISTACALMLAYQTRITWLWFTPLLIVFFATGIILFPFGFGFDPFIHHATERLLIATGTIAPKPLYYVGFYALVVWASFLLRIPYAMLSDVLVVCAIVAIAAPLLTITYRLIDRSRSIGSLALVPILMIPMVYLTQSTPFALSLVLLGVGSSLLVLMSYDLIPRWTLIPVALMSFVIHPIPGVFALLLASYFYIDELPIRTSKTLITVFVYSVGALALPALLFILAMIHPELSVTLLFHDSSLLPNVRLTLSPYVSYVDGLYLYRSLWPLFVALAVVVGINLMHLTQQKRFSRPLILSILTAGTSWFIVTLFFNFDFATVTEQSDFAQRIGASIVALALPFMVCSFSEMTRVFLRWPLALRVGLVLVVTTSILSSFYLSYPRYDAYAQSKGYFASEHDVQAIDTVRRSSEGTPYVVLANQIVSGLAIDIAGFEKTPTGLNRYALPTNGELAKYYVLLMNEPERSDEIAMNVRQLSGADTVYVIINSYWSNAATTLAILESQGARRLTDTKQQTTVLQLEP